MRKLYVSRNGHLVAGQAKYAARFKVWCERHALEIHVAGWYVGVYR